VRITQIICIVYFVYSIHFVVLRSKRIPPLGPSDRLPIPYSAAQFIIFPEYLWTFSSGFETLLHSFRGYSGIPFFTGLTPTAGPQASPSPNKNGILVT
jgi:hypothetical protein